MDVWDRVMRGWVEWLDVDLPRAQAVLRLPRTARPVPPQGCPPVYEEGWDGVRVLVAAAIEAPEPEPLDVQPTRSVTPRRLGAYGRRSRK